MKLQVIWVLFIYLQIQQFYPFFFVNYLSQTEWSMSKNLIIDISEQLD